jgi:DNA-directed RNA polymerase specialized sigma24 family protein
MQKTKEVTRENFEIFLNWLSPEPENIGAEYEKLRFRLITFFASRRCFFVEELADEVINRVVVLIEKQVIENKTAYIYGVARNVYLESLRREKVHTNIDDMSLAADAPPDPDFSNECLDKCLKELPPVRRDLILDYFSEQKSEKIASRRKASAEMEISQTALRMRVLRIKQQLSVCVKDCMK